MYTDYSSLQIAVLVLHRHYHLFQYHRLSAGKYCKKIYMSQSQWLRGLRRGTVGSNPAGAMDACLL